LDLFKFWVYHEVVGKLGETPALFKAKIDYLEGVLDDLNGGVNVIELSDETNSEMGS
jgi:hypothetical protein